MENCREGSRIRRCLPSRPKYSIPEKRKSRRMKSGLVLAIPYGLKAESVSKNSGVISWSEMGASIWRDLGTLKMPSCLLSNSRSILARKSAKCSRRILKPAACLCPQKAIKYSWQVSRRPVISVCSGLRQLATSLSPSSLRAIDGLSKASVRRPAMSPMIPCSISVES